MNLIRIAIVLVAVICQSYLASAADVKVLSNEALDSKARFNWVDQAKFEGFKEVLAQKAALEMDRVVMSLTERAEKIQSAALDDEKYQIVVRSEQEMTGNSGKQVWLFDRTFEVTFLGQNKDQISVVQTGLKISDK